MKRCIIILLIVMLTVFSTNAFALAEEIDRGSSAYCHLSRYFVNNYNVVIKTRTDTINMETDSSCHLAKRRSGGTQSTIVANTFTQIYAKAKLTRMNGATDQESKNLYNVDQIICTASLSALQYAVSTEHLSDGVAYNYTTDTNETVTDISVYYY